LILRKDIYFLGMAILHYTRSLTRSQALSIKPQVKKLNRFPIPPEYAYIYRVEKNI
jgi:hypothetical protein